MENANNRLPILIKKETDNFLRDVEKGMKNQITGENFTENEIQDVKKEIIEEEGGNMIVRILRQLSRHENIHDLIKMDSDNQLFIKTEDIDNYCTTYCEKYINSPENHYTSPPKKDIEHEYMENHPPILSVDGTKHIQNQFTIFDPQAPDTPWLTVQSDNKNYKWMFDNISKPQGLTYYFVMDLMAAARARELDSVP